MSRNEVLTSCLIGVTCIFKVRMSLTLEELYYTNSRNGAEENQGPSLDLVLSVLFPWFSLFSFFFFAIPN